MKKTKHTFLKVALLLCTFIFCLPVFYSAQSTVIKEYGIEDGLHSSTCYWTEQDSKGYLWIGTDVGIVKYDGYTFKNYGYEKGLDGTSIFKIHEDRHGKVWFINSNGILVYYIHKTDSFYHIKANDLISSLIKTYPIDFAFDNRDTLYITTDKKGYIKVIPPYYNDIKVMQYATSCGYIKPLSGNQFIYGANILNYPIVPPSIPLIFDSKNNTNLSRTDTSFRYKLYGSHYALAHKNGRIFFSSTNTIYECVNNTFKILLTFPDTTKNIYDIFNIYIDSKNNLWVSTNYNGVYVYDISSAIPKLINCFLRGINVTRIIEDKNGGMWLSSIEKGLLYFPNTAYKFHNRTHGLSVDEILGFAKFKNELIIVGEDARILNFLNLKTNKIYTYKLKEHTPTWNVKTLDENSYVVFGSPSLIIKNSKEHPSEITFTNKENKKQIIKIKAAEQLNDSAFLASETGSLYQVNKQTGNAVLLINNLPTINSIYQYNGNTFLATKKGLYIYKNGIAIELRDTVNKSSFIAKQIIAIDNLLYISTKGRGLLILENNKLIKQLTQANGLIGDVIWSMTKDKYNNIWVGTNRGISCIKKENSNYVIKNLDTKDGIVSAEISQLLVDDSVLYYSCVKGLGQIKLNDLFNKNEIEIPVIIENLKVNTTNLNLDSIAPLSHDVNFFQISYKGISIKYKGNILYKYKLVGLDTNWTYTKNTFVQYTTLPPNTYRFVVYAINSNGIASQTPAEISFIIKPPFWQTWWFISLITISIASIVFFIYKQRIDFIKKQEKEKTVYNKQLAESELKALRSQMNPHFMFNAINSIQHFVLKNDSKSAQKYLTKFARLIRSVLENSKHEFIPLNKEIESLELYLELEALRSSFTFEYEIILEDKLNADYYHVPPMIIQPYVENAILHGLAPLHDRKGRLTLTFSQTNNAIVNCIIDDNGIGREKAQEIKIKKDLGRTSLGMEVTQNRIELLNAQHKLFTKISVVDKTENGIATGTRIELNIDLINKKND